MSNSLGEREFKKALIVDKIPVKPPGKPRFKVKNLDKQDTRGNRDNNDASTEEEYCTKLLSDGYVQSFVDFYHLTQRADPNNTDGTFRKINCTPDEMAFIRNNLVLAEISRRQGNIIGVYTAYNKLAASYKKKRDWKTAIFFQEKCLEVAQLTTDLKAEMLANHTLGEVYQQMNDFESARVCHERHEEIAKSIDNPDELVTANIELHKVYLILAQRLENENEIDNALKMYGLCLNSSIKCMDLAAQGEANGKIGNLLLRQGDAAGALPFLQQHSQISTDIGDTEARCRASSALAWALDSLGEATRALNELSLVHSISEQAGDAYLQSQACCALGTLYSKVGQLSDAVVVFQRHFELVKAITSQSSAQPSGPSTQGKGGGNNDNDSENRPKVTNKDLELARVYVGVSRGNLMMESYMSAIAFDMSSLLDWKLNRTELGKNSTTTTTNTTNTLG